jgi:hypothetical protein
MQYWDDGPKPEKPGYAAHGSNGGVTSFDPLKHGSVFGWHGSQLGNWHVIMRTGLKNLSLSSYVRGTAHGPGIYFGYDHSTSAGCVGVASRTRAALPGVCPCSDTAMPPRPPSALALTLTRRPHPSPRHVT